MQAPKTLRKPANWQDFETLCKKLWGEVWSCSDIKKNGRSGQNQNGVDIYGIPEGEKQYFGIQCKGKNEYYGSQFTIKEILSEIELAKSFEPKLKKLYFATTAVKDAEIEEFIRKQNIYHINSGLFEVHIYCWEDIVDLIDEHRHTYNWYVKSQNYKSNFDVLVTFGDGTLEKALTPIFKQETIRYLEKIIPADPYQNPLVYLTPNTFFKIDKVVIPDYVTKVNLSYSGFNFKIHNKGSSPLEDYQLLFNIENDIIDLSDTNEIYDGPKIASIYHIPNLRIEASTKSGKITPSKSILVSDDVFTSEEIFLKPLLEDYEILISWRLLSKNHKDSGSLKLIVKPEIRQLYREVLSDDYLKQRAGTTTKTEIEDYIIVKKD